MQQNNNHNSSFIIHCTVQQPDAFILMAIRAIIVQIEREESHSSELQKL